MKFEDFLLTRDDAARSYVCGDAEPLRGLTTRSSPATFFGPGGGAVEGAEQVVERYVRDASRFTPGGTSALEILQSGSSGDVAWWVGHQVATVKRPGQETPVSMTLRVTELFRRESGRWRLVHRHADMQS